MTIAPVGNWLGALIDDKVIDAEGLAVLGSAKAIIGVAGLVLAVLIVGALRRSQQQVVSAKCGSGDLEQAASPQGTVVSV